MKLIIKRDQADKKGFLGGHKGVKFSLSGRCEVSGEERDLIEKYKVSDFPLASHDVKFKSGSSITISISVSDLINGKSVEAEDISTLLDLEEAMKEGCKSLKSLLKVMKSFGGEEVFEIE